MANTFHTLLKDSRLMKLWVAQGVSTFGNMLTFLAIPILVYEETGSKAALSLTIFFGGVPQIIVGSFAGALVDRLDRRVIMVLGDVLRGLVMVPILFISGSWLIPTIYAVVAFKSLFGSFFQPAMSSVIPSLVQRDQLISVNSLFTFSFMTLQFLSPLVGAWLLGMIGIRMVLLIDIGSFIISALLIAWTAVPAHEVRHPKPLSMESLVEDIREGLHFIGGSKILKIMLLTGIICMLGQGFISPVWLPYIVEYLNEPKEKFGILVSMQGLGCIVGTIIIMLVGVRKKASVKGLYMFFLAGSGITIFMQITTQKFYIFLIWGTLVGVFLAARNVAHSTLIQHATEARMLGRVNSSFGILRQAAMLAAVLMVGLISQWVSTRFLFILAASLWLIGTLQGAIRMAFVPEPHVEKGEQP